ncbi:unnamed protein product [Agarophyton chilense]
MTELPFIPGTNALPPRTPRPPPNLPPQLRFVNRDSESYVSPLSSPLTSASTPALQSGHEKSKTMSPYSYSPKEQWNPNLQVPLSPLARTMRIYNAATSPNCRPARTPRRSRTSLETPFVQLDAVAPFLVSSPQDSRTSNSFQASYASKSTSSALKGAEAKRRAVLIGITYAGTNDVELLPKSAEHLALFHNFLIRKLGFDKRNIWVLSDKPHSAAGAVLLDSTHANIVNSITWLILNAKPGDNLIFAFCGHGIQRRKDGTRSVEQCIIPSDYPTSPPITAKMMSSLLIGNLNMGVHLTIILDCRFSNKMLGLPYIHYVRRGKKNRFFVDGTPEVDEKDPLLRTSPMNGITGSSRHHKEYLEMKKQIAEEQRDALAEKLFDKGDVVCLCTGSEPKKKFISFSSSPRDKTSLSSAFVSVMSYDYSRKIDISFQKALVDISNLVGKGPDAFLPQLLSSYKLKIGDQMFKG